MENYYAEILEIFNEHRIIFTTKNHYLLEKIMWKRKNIIYWQQIMAI